MYDLPLLDEQPVMFMKRLAVEIGVESAIIIQQLQFEIEDCRTGKDNYIDKQYWIYTSQEKLYERVFSFWSKAIFDSYFENLVGLGFIKYKKTDESGYLYYTLNQDLLSKLQEEVRKKDEEKRLKKAKQMEVSNE